MSYTLGPISEIADVSSGYAFKSSWFGEGNDKIVRIGDLQNGHINQENLKECDASKNDVPDRFKVKPGDILMALSGATTGKTAYTRKTDDGLYLNQRVAIIRGKNGVNSNYLKYVLRNESFVESLLLSAGGAAQPNLSPRNLKSFKIPLPPQEEQKRIAAILDKADTIRRKRQQAIDLADEFLRSVFLDMFGDPVTNSKGWEIQDGNKVLQNMKYGTSQKCTDTQEDNALPVLRIPNITNERITLEGLKFTVLGEKEKKKLLLTKGDLLFVRTNGNPEYIGRCAVFDADIDALYASYLIKAEVNTEYFTSSNFVKHIVSFPTYRLKVTREAKTTAGNYNISTVGLKNLNFITPPKDLQKKFLMLATIVERNRSKLNINLQETRCLFKALSQRAFRGELTQSKTA